MERWLWDAFTAASSPELGRPDDEDTLRYCVYEAAIALCFARLGDLDAAHQAVRRVVDTSSKTIALHSFPPSAEDDWGVVEWGLFAAVWVSLACLELAIDPHSLASMHDVVVLVKSLFPAEEPISTPPCINTGDLLDNVGTVLSYHCRHLEFLRRMDESLCVARSNFDWYAARGSPSTPPTHYNSPHIKLALDLVRNLVYAGQWSTALKHTTAIFHALVPSPGLSTSDQWSVALLIHCSILSELGRVEEAAECLNHGIDTLTSADGWDEHMRNEPLFVRRVLLRKDLADQMDFAQRCDMLDLGSQNNSGCCLDASCILADIGDHERATKHAQQALASIDITTMDISNQWKDFGLIQQRTDSIIALTVAFVLGGHIQDAVELLSPLFDVYKKELHYQRNLYPGYAVALRLAGWVFAKVGKVEEGKKMKDREVGLAYRLDGEDDEETLRVVRIRLAMEERRPAIQRVREILGVEPYQHQPTSDKDLCVMYHQPNLVYLY